MATLAGTNRGARHRAAIAASLCGMLLVLAEPAEARVEALRWSHSDPSNVSGFLVHWGTSSRSYGAPIDVGRPPQDSNGKFSYDLNVPDDATVYVAVSAYNSETQSPLSNERIRYGSGGEPEPPPPPPPSPSEVPAGDDVPEHPDAVWFQSFESASLGTSVPGFLDTGSANSLSENDSVFSVVQQDGNRALWTASTATNVHSHYVSSGSSAWANYEYRGRMLITASDGGVGVTAYSAFPNDVEYYRLRRREGRPDFHLAMRPGVSCGDPDTGVVPVRNVWYEFALRVTRSSGTNTIQAKVWPQGSSEPGSWQATCSDANGPTSGAIGVWSMGPGEKYWDDLQAIDVSGSLPPPPDDPPPPADSDGDEPLGAPGRPFLVQ